MERDVEIKIYIQDDVQYTLESTSLVEAVDCLFKTYLVLGIEFAPECVHIWEFLQQRIYNIPITSDRAYKHLSDLADKVVIPIVTKHISELTANEEEVEQEVREPDEEQDDENADDDSDF